MTTALLFTGYAPVHFLCFKPLYDRLSDRAGIEIFVSGGLRSGERGAFTYDGAGLYRPFGIPNDRILSIEEIQERRFNALFSANKRIIAPRDRFGKLVQIFHGVSFRNRAVRAENLDYDHLFLAGPYMQRSFIEHDLLRENDPRGVPIGFMKTDPLLAENFDRDALLARLELDGSRPIALFAPTGEAGNALETIGQAAVRALANDGAVDLLIKPHDHPHNAVDWIRELAPLEGPHVRLVRERDVIPLLRLADLLITDASSVANEFTLLDRPIIFIDVPELIARSRRTGAAIDLLNWGRKGGTVVDDPQGLVREVRNALDHRDRLSEVRQAIARDLFFNPGHATDAALRWVNNHLVGG